MDDHEVSQEARDALHAAIKASGELRIEVQPPEGDYLGNSPISA
jgi:hypothetical protein